MATLVYVTPATRGRIYVRVVTEQGDFLWEDFISAVWGETAAETVEMFMLIEHDMVASWHWSLEFGYNLCGQFVPAAKDGRRAMKEVLDSQARHFDI